MGFWRDGFEFAFEAVKREDNLGAAGMLKVILIPACLDGAQIIGHLAGLALPYVFDQ